MRMRKEVIKLLFADDESIYKKFSGKDKLLALIKIAGYMMIYKCQ